jgi:hypothetical protein
MPFSVAEVCLDPDLAQHVIIHRSLGQFGPGGWQNTVTLVPSYGVVTVASAKALQQVPEGDRLTGAVEFCSVQPINATSEEGSNVSDQVEWQGNLYRVESKSKWVDFGFYSAILVRMTGS